MNGVIFCEYFARTPENPLLLCYCGLGTAIKVSAILFNERQEGLALAMPGIQQCFRSFPKMKNNP
jgi:hypothetical protein